MVIKITPQQAKRVNVLLRKLCANYDGGNCLLLDDGEPCVCVQSISKYGIYCNYFKNAVLPVDEGLYAEIMKPMFGAIITGARGLAGSFTSPASRPSQWKKLGT